MIWRTDTTVSAHARHVVHVRDTAGAILAELRLLGLDTLEAAAAAALNLAHQIPRAASFDLTDRAVNPRPIVTRSVVDFELVR